MEIFIIRSEFFESATLGNLFVMDGAKILFQCKTLEPGWKNNAKRVSCIPSGKYDMKFEYSSRFLQKLWELKNVLGRSEIKIHTANFAYDLMGCIAVGEYHTNLDGDGIPDVAASRKTLEKLHKVTEGLEKMRIKIYGVPE
ncbi:MAG: hypothetical protein IPN68_17920 [Bacteroidetes bacterium]|nr:hypothetical protein [Bacteroidota bacterium]